MDVTQSIPYMPGDSLLVDNIVYELKSQGIFDKFRKECLADVDTKPAYQNLHQRVEGIVTQFLKHRPWKVDLNKNQLREKLRKHILDLNILDQGVDRIVDQVVNPKVATVFVPEVEEVVYKYLGIEAPCKEPPSVNGDYSRIHQQLEIRTDNLLPHDLESVSPDSVKSHDREELRVNSPDEMDIDNNEDILSKDITDKIRDDSMRSMSYLSQKGNDAGGTQSSKLVVESTVFESTDGNDHNRKKEENLDDSKLSGISDLTSVDSKNSSMAQDSQLERHKSPVDLDSQISHVSSTVERHLKPDQKFEEIVDDDCITESSSEINLRIDMSPLTPVRIYDHIENSSDAQPAFDQSASFINKKGVSFSIEEFKALKSKQDKVPLEIDKTPNSDDAPKDVSDSDEISSKSISRHRASIESKTSSDSFKAVNQIDTDSGESKSSSVFESMIRAKMKILVEQLDIIESKTTNKFVTNDDSNETVKDSISSPVSKSFFSPSLHDKIDSPPTAENMDHEKKYVDSDIDQSNFETSKHVTTSKESDLKQLYSSEKTDHKRDSYKHDSGHEHREKKYSSKERYKDKRSGHKDDRYKDDYKDKHSSSREEQKTKRDSSRVEQREKRHSSKDAQKEKHESSKHKSKDHNDSLKIEHKNKVELSSDTNKERGDKIEIRQRTDEVKDEHRERKDSSKEKSRNRESSSKDEHRDRHLHKESRPKERHDSDSKKSGNKQKHESDKHFSKYDKKETSSLKKHSGSQPSKSSSSSVHSSKSKSHSSERHGSSSHSEKNKQSAKSEKTADRVTDRDIVSADRSQESIDPNRDRDAKYDKNKRSTNSSDRDRKREGEKKHKKISDDHYSSSGRINRTRRSTDRDSNDGNSGFTKGTSSQPGIAPTDNNKTNNNGNSKTATTSNSSSSPNDNETVGQENFNNCSQHNAVALDDDKTSKVQVEKMEQEKDQLNVPMQPNDTIKTDDTMNKTKSENSEITSNAQDGNEVVTAVHENIDEGSQCNIEANEVVSDGNKASEIKAKNDTIEADEIKYIPKLKRPKIVSQETNEAGVPLDYETIKEVNHCNTAMPVKNRSSEMKLEKPIQCNEHFNLTIQLNDVIGIDEIKNASKLKMSKITSDIQEANESDVIITHENVNEGSSDSDKTSKLQANKPVQLGEHGNTTKRLNDTLNTDEIKYTPKKKFKIASNVQKTNETSVTIANENVNESGQHNTLANAGALNNNKTSKIQVSKPVQSEEQNNTTKQTNDTPKADNIKYLPKLKKPKGASNAQEAKESTVTIARESVNKNNHRNDAINAVALDNNKNSEMQSRKPVRLEEQLNTPIRPSDAIISDEIIYMPKLKKPKIASNAQEALKIMRIRKEIDLEERRRHVEALKKAEERDNIPQTASQVYSNLSGPEVEFTCSKGRKVDDNKMTPGAGEIINIKILEVKEVMFEESDQEMRLADEADLLYFDDNIISSARTELEKFNKFLDKAQQQFNSNYNNVLHLVNCSENIVDAFRKVRVRGRQLEIVHLCMNGFVAAEKNETTTPRNLRTKKVAFTPNLETTTPSIKKENSADDSSKDLQNEFLDNKSNEMLRDVVTNNSSPKQVNNSFEASSPEYNDKINEDLLKASKQEIMEIILGGADMNYCINNTEIALNSKEDTNLSVSRKRKISRRNDSSENDMQSSSAENNNKTNESSIKMRRLTASGEQALNNGKLSGRADSNASSASPTIDLPTKRSSKYMGKPKTVGLSKVKSHSSEHSKSLRSEKSVEKYHNENTEGYKRQGLQPNRLQKLQASDKTTVKICAFMPKLPLMPENS